MQKRVNAKYPVHEFIEKRWSPRSFSDKPVEKEKINRMLEAARWAASSYNEQPWRFIVGINKDDTYDKIFETLMDDNKIWVKSAPVLMIAVAKMQFTKTGKDNKFAFHNTGLATQNMIVQATHDGLYVHQMGGYSPDKARELFNVPEGYEPVDAIALGYIGDPDDAPEKYIKSEKAERKRKEPEELFFEKEFGTPLLTLK